MRKPSRAAPAHFRMPGRAAWLRTLTIVFAAFGASCSGPRVPPSYDWSWREDLHARKIEIDGREFAPQMSGVNVEAVAASAGFKTADAPAIVTIEFHARFPRDHAMIAPSPWPDPHPNERPHGDVRALFLRDSRGEVVGSNWYGLEFCSGEEIGHFEVEFDVRGTTPPFELLWVAEEPVALVPDARRSRRSSGGGSFPDPGPCLLLLN